MDKTSYFNISILHGGGRFNDYGTHFVQSWSLWLAGLTFALLYKIIIIIIIEAKKTQQ